MSVKRRAALPSVVLAGRPNVGKSTLFNRITGSRKAIVTPTPGTTRDLVGERAEWQGTTFRLVDAGGMFGASDDPLQAEVLERGRQGIASADVILFVVDGRDGVVGADEAVADAVRRVGVPVVVAVNKCDDHRARGRAMEFYQFGFESVLEISAEHATGVGDLLDGIVSRLPGRSSAVARGDAADRNGESDGETAIAIVGRPNVGKSSLVNRLLREERMLVDERPGTTRDAVDEVLRWHGQQFRIVDTAGIRRPGRVAGGGQVESVSVIVARRAIERADVAVLLVDAHEGVTDQDAAIAGEVERRGCGIVIAANKWDLLKGDGDRASEFDEVSRRQLKFLEYAPLLHVSALTGERLPKLMETIDRVAAARRRRVPTGELNRFVERVTRKHPPVSPGRRAVRVLYAAQTGVAPPTFVCFTNVATEFHFSYIRFLTNRLRAAFGFEGTPIRLHVRRRGK